MCQHLHITLFNRILSFHLKRIPLNRFHFGDVNFCLKKLEKENKYNEKLKQKINIYSIGPRRQRKEGGRKRIRLNIQKRK